MSKEDRAKDEFRKKRAEEAALKFQDPSHELKVFGVTGTNGKTTTTYLVEAILKEAGLRPAVIGTIENRFEAWREPSQLTTPGSEQLQGLLRKVSDEGAKSVIMEVSSHGLDQYRVWATKFTGAIFTNLTQDHLDYHETLENYFLAKQRLFLEYRPEISIVNIEDPWGQRLHKECLRSKLEVFSFARKNADITYEKIQQSFTGISGTLKTPLGDREVNSPLVGEYNVQNICGAVGVGIYLEKTSNLPWKKMKSALQEAHVPGRLEAVTKKHAPYRVFVDYAHTPDALEKVLSTLKPLCKNNLLVLFGCGGDRDSGKRPQMGAIADQWASRIWVTSDNPRTENPQQIIQGILEGIKSKNKTKIIENRRLAIEDAVASLEAGDFLVIAGKGHEDYQIIGQEKLHFDDREVARACLNNK